MLFICSMNSFSCSFFVLCTGVFLPFGGDFLVDFFLDFGTIFFTAYTVAFTDSFIVFLAAGPPFDFDTVLKSFFRTLVTSCFVCFASL